VIDQIDKIWLFSEAVCDRDTYGRCTLKRSWSHKKNPRLSATARYQRTFLDTMSHSISSVSLVCTRFDINEFKSSGNVL
jgi:hypothetical protein